MLFVIFFSINITFCVNKFVLKRNLFMISLQYILVIDSMVLANGCLVGFYLFFLCRYGFLKSFLSIQILLIIKVFKFCQMFLKIFLKQN